MKNIRSSLFLKLLVSVLLVIFIPFFIFNIIAYRSNYRAVFGQMLELNTELLSIGAENLESYLLEIEKASMKVYGSSEVRAVLLSEEQYDGAGYYRIQLLLQDIIATDAKLFGAVLADSYNGRVSSWILTDQADRIQGEELIIDEEFQVIRNKNGRDAFICRYDLKDEPYQLPLCEIFLYSRADFLQEFAMRMRGEEDNLVYIYINNENEPVYSTSEEKITPGDLQQLRTRSYLDTEIEGKKGKLLMVTREYKDKEIMLVKFMSDHTIGQAARDTLRITVAVQVMLVVFIVFFVFLLFRMMILPINRIVKNMERVNQGAYEYEAVSGSRDEIWKLEKTYEEMLANIDHLINKEYKNALEISRTRLNMLQAQINPHFLYNMLQYISTNALKSGAEEVSEQLVQLGAMFQYTMDMSSKEICLEEELEHTQRYMTLQSGRFSSLTDLEIICPPELLERKIPKMILQPLIENSMKHGLADLPYQGRIKIEIWKREGLVFKISDNGKGFTQEEISVVQKKYEAYEVLQEQRRGIGLVNVLQRLNLYTDGKFKWKIESIPYQETIITLELRGDSR